MCWRCSPTLRAQSCTSAIGTITARRTASRASKRCRATRYSSPWALTPSACPPKTTPSRPRSTPKTRRRRTSRPWSTSSRRWAPCSTGLPRSRPARKTTTSGRSGCSSNYTKTASPTARKRPSTGAPAATPCSPTSRWWKAAASAAARPSSSATSRSGTSRSPNTPRSFCRG